MKGLTFAIVTCTGLVASQASAQVLYSSMPPSILFPPPVSYHTGPGNNFSGDVIRITPATATYDTITVLYVATAPGTYNVTINRYNAYSWPHYITCAPAGGPVTIPTGGSFPSVWKLIFTGPVTTIGAADQAFTFQSSSRSFSTAYANNPATPFMSDPFGGFFMDSGNANCYLEPGGSEWFRFNLQFALSLGPLPAVGGLELPRVTVEPIDNLIAIPEKKMVNARISP